VKSSDDLSPLLNYIATHCQDGERLPPLTEIATELSISIAALREQLEVARSLGIVEVRPKTGIRRVSFSFTPAVLSGLTYATRVNSQLFQAYSDLRRHLELAYWNEAVRRLTPEDHEYLRDLVKQAHEKLAQQPPQIPQQEHRELHLIMYRRLDNTFVTGLLEAFWETYEAIGLDVFLDMDYLHRVWNYHEKIVDAICLGDYEVGYVALLEHMELLNQRPKLLSNQNFE